MTQVLQYRTISPVSSLGSKGDKEKRHNQHRKPPANKAQKTHPSMSMKYTELENRARNRSMATGAQIFLGLKDALGAWTHSGSQSWDAGRKAL